MPMHFLGLNGFPRRIPDYPDGYIGWNTFITWGTCMTFQSIILFLYIVAVSIFNTKHKEINNKIQSRWSN